MRIIDNIRWAIKARLRSHRVICIQDCGKIKKGEWQLVGGSLISSKEGFCQFYEWKLLPEYFQLSRFDKIRIFFNIYKI